MPNDELLEHAPTKLRTYAQRCFIQANQVMKETGNEAEFEEIWLRGQSAIAKAERLERERHCAK